MQDEQRQTPDDETGERRRRGLRAIVAPVVRFLHVEGASGIVLALAAAGALVWANWSALPPYEASWTGARGIGALAASPRFVVNDVLMTAFFYLAGLELRRERSFGELRVRARAILPVVAALGGMIVPALIYLAIARGAARGWGIPMATDIAFAVGVLSLVGRGLPVGLRVFLLALAIIDDLGAIIVIAAFYSHGVAVSGLVLAALAIAALLAARRLPRASGLVTVLAAPVMWLGLWHAHVHPTLAGVVLGLLAPADPVRAARVEQALHPWVAFAVMPLFALANAGLELHTLPLANASVIAGVMIGLVVGKPIGVVGATALAVRFGGAELPSGSTWSGVALVGTVAGLGFTMSLFIADLAFADHPELEAAARLGLLAGSVLAIAAAVPCSYLARRATALALHRSGS